MNRISLILIAGSSLTLAAPGFAQETKPTQPEQPAQPQPKQPAPPEPTLDELLGLPKANPATPGQPAKPRPEAVDPTKTDLERKLSAREVAEGFKVAIDLMGETADRLQTSRDTGLTTQRMQEDIIRKLDQLIKAAEQQQQQSKKSSSKGQRDQQKNQPNQPQQQQQSQEERDAAGKGEPASDAMAPPGEDPNLNPGAAARGAAWGALPDRVRDALLQGNADKYSSLYQKWTEAYYRRLAEEGYK